MKLTKRKIKEIIKEELENILAEQEKEKIVGTFMLQGFPENGNLAFHHVETNAWIKAPFQQWGISPDQARALSHFAGRKGIKIKDLPEHPRAARFLASKIKNQEFKDPELLGEFYLVQAFGWQEYK